MRSFRLLAAGASVVALFLSACQPTGGGQTPTSCTRHDRTEAHGRSRPRVQRRRRRSPGCQSGREPSRRCEPRCQSGRQPQPPLPAAAASPAPRRARAPRYASARPTSPSS